MAVSDRFTYSFSVWPAETWDFSRALFDLFRCINTRIDMEFTEPDFERFRSFLNHDGFTLREVTRIPYMKPELVL